MSNLRRVIAVAAVVALVAPSIATADPLAAGKPAGVKQAQMEAWPPLVWIALAGIVAAGIAGAAATGNSPSTFTTAPATTGTTS
jgi:hypothetical protein